MASGCLRNIPSPEHGASRTIRSKYPLKILAKRSADSLVTTTFVAPKRSIFSTSIFARLLEISLETRSPSPAR